MLKYMMKPVYWYRETLIIPFAPKYPFINFSRSSCNIFLSKKKPLLIGVELAE